MKKKLAELNHTLKETKKAMNTKQRDINKLKRDHELAQQLKRTVERLKRKCTHAMAWLLTFSSVKLMM